MIRNGLLALAAASALLPASAQAYGVLGHRTIARIAMKNVRPETRRAVKHLLRGARLLDTPECKANTAKRASTWADCVRANVPRYKPTAPWHYQDVEVCQPFDLAPACKNGACVSAQITRDRAILADRSAPERDRVEALAFLIHFMGDLHQPLHAGEKADKGGNAVNATFEGQTGEHMNLHSIWDTNLAEVAIRERPNLVHRYSAEEKATLGAGTVEDWSRESWQTAHDYTYATANHGDPCGPTPPQVDLTPADVQALIPVERLEIERAGLRLARVLDEALAERRHS